MDTRKLLVLTLLLMAVGPGWAWYLRHEYDVHPEWKRPASLAPTPPTTAPSAEQTAATVMAGPTTHPTIAGATTQPGEWSVVAGETQEVTVGSGAANDSTYHMALKIVPRGAALDSVVLNEYRQVVDGEQRYTFQDPYDVDPAHTLSLQTLAVSIDGTRIDLSDEPWTLIDKTDHSARYAVEVDERGKPVVRVTKAYQVAQASGNPTTPRGYEVGVDCAVENLSGQKHVVALQFNGPTAPHSETAQQGTEIVAGYDNDGYVKLDHQPLAGFSGTNVSKDYVPNADNLPMLWVGASGNYFNAIVRPGKEKLLAAAVARTINPDAPVEQRCVLLQLTTTAFDLDPGAKADAPLTVFFGPKARELLSGRYYSSFPLQYDGTLVMLNNGGLGWICGLCTFPWLISFLVMVLAMFHLVLRDWGLAIIVLVCLVRIMLHPITKRSQISMLKMQKLAPEIERLKKKFGDDKEGFGKAQMEVYKTQGFSPILGCAPMFLQTPIFIALWRALQTTFELRQAPFLFFFGIHFTWIHDLSQPDQLYKFATPIPLPFGWHLAGINLLPLLMAVVQFINQKYFMPRPAAVTPEQEQQQKMMTYMTLVFPFMFYTFPSGLNLYYLTSTSLGIIESKIIRAHIKKAEALEAAQGPVIVDAGKSSRAARRRQAQEPEKKGFISKFMEKVDQMVKDAEKKKKKG